jgi:hypothetical protein
VLLPLREGRLLTVGVTVILLLLVSFLDCANDRGLLGKLLNKLALFGIVLLLCNESVASEVGVVRFNTDHNLSPNNVIKVLVSVSRRVDPFVDIEELDSNVFHQLQRIGIIEFIVKGVLFVPRQLFNHLSNLLEVVYLPSLRISLLLEQINDLFKALLVL